MTDIPDLSSDYHVIETMIAYGGSFVQALGEAARRADGVNLRRLREAFPDYWNAYRELSLQRFVAKERR